MSFEPKAIVGGVATSVAAASLATDVEAQGFEGFYAGISVGSFMGDVPSEDASDPYEFLGNLIAGGFFGYNHSLGNDVLVGFEFNVTGPQQIQEVGSLQDNYTMRAMVEARGRAGYRVNDMILAYGFLGVTNTMRTSDEGRDYTLYGVNAGIGGEYMISPSFGIGAEYTYRNLNAYDDFEIPQADSSSIALRATFHF